MSNTVYAATAMLVLGASLLSQPWASAFQSAPISLVFPSGARTLSMGEIGTALADDEMAPYWNPAGLGVPNPRWTHGAGTQFHERLLPAMKLPGLWHGHWCGVWQRPIWGGFAAQVNYLNYGEIEMTDEEGGVTDSFNSWDLVAGLSWGFNFEEIGLRNNFFGLSAKYVHSALAPTGDMNEAIGRTLAIDAGYLQRFAECMRLGVLFQNMGPPIWYIDPTSPDPLPFTIAVALGVKKSIAIQNLHIVELNAETRISREFVKTHPNGRPDPFWKAIYTDIADSPFRENIDEIQLNSGGEVVVFNTGALRSGILWDWVGQRYELHLGHGFRIFSHFQFDFSYIYSPEGFMSRFIRNFTAKDDEHRQGSYGVRHAQWGVSFVFFNIGRWNMDDREWWRFR